MSSHKSDDESEYCDDDEDNADEINQYENNDNDDDNEYLTKERRFLRCDRELNEYQDDDDLEYEQICNKLTLDPDLNPKLVNSMIEAEKGKAKNGLLAGSFFIIIGAVLSVIGVSGVINWNFSFVGLNSSLINAAPGVVLIIVGFLIIVITNYNITIRH
jgi:hypothetical protein